MWGDKMSRVPPNFHIPLEISLNDQIIAKAVEEYGTPIYLYDSSLMKKNYYHLKSFMPEEMQICYSVKANPNVHIMKEFISFGAFIEVASYGELQFAQWKKVMGKKIILVGPGKTEKLLRLAVKMHVAYIVIESEYEFCIINKIAEQLKKQIKVAFRVHTMRRIKGMLSMSGNNQFGMDEGQVIELLMKRDNYPYIHFCGIHIYFGTGILNENDFLKNTQLVFDISEEIQYKTNCKFEFIDIGGGLGIPYYEDESCINLENIKDELKMKTKKYIKNNGKTKIMGIEAGRYLVGSAGIFITRVIDKKTVNNKDYAILDGGTNNVTYHEKFGFEIPPMKVLGKNSQAKQSITLCGPLCTPEDRLAINVEIEEIVIGDILVLYQVGAYGLTVAPGMFLSHGYPAELLWKNKKIYLIRRKLDWQEILYIQGGILDEVKLW
jgi:diaminopimelate decarboxylase